MSPADGSPGHHLACLAGLPLNMSLPVTWPLVSLTWVTDVRPPNICPSFPTYPHDKNSVFQTQDLSSRTPLNAVNRNGGPKGINTVEMEAKMGRYIPKYPTVILDMTR